MPNREMVVMSSALKRASRENDAPIWSRLSREALKPSKTRRVTNLNKIEDLTRSGDVVFFAGKVLGTGIIAHDIILSSFSISRTAAAKVIAAGGTVLGYDEMVKKHPTGKGVTLLG